MKFGPNFDIKAHLEGGIKSKLSPQNSILRKHNLAMPVQ